MSKFEFLRDNFTKYGYKIFPVIENSKEPLIDKWQLDASSDTRQLVYWLENAKKIEKWYFSIGYSNYMK